ncbi:Gfo/Idh/MocA family oxidoreductase [Pedobacter frigiditerrae]|uniref:Gfo/Idh/MocA family oxidoreductase n=1 Tax=Pedobacter frigiditerrae TaxID=2530452 RepID=A0A4R0N0U3_9SPHI|nr:Gfo/Idh/MocA family oxidoreductase [Pedobacter frigiditerrae]TCC93368.1 Gfo/Idh/MocA family oxidoreductase [Pedobacter frigiditerrae]
MKKILFLIALLVTLSQIKAQEVKPLEVAIAGLSHDHIYGILQHYKKGTIKLLGIAEANPVLVAKFKKSYQIPDSLFYKDLRALLKNKHPEVVMAFNAVSEHINVVRVCAPLKINVMVEKPLATTVKDAEEIVALAKNNSIQVLTNYETTWYASNQNVYQQVKANAVGDVVKMIVHDGHQGPKEIGCSAEFLEWLTDPIKNGAGALTDFGCYGANLMTWLMNNQMPISVSAVTHQIKPTVYPKVDDDATIILEYPNATGIVEASWNWPFSIKDLEVFGKKGYLQAVNGNTLRSKNGNNNYDILKLEQSEKNYRDYVPYVTAVLRGEIKPVNDLSSLANNLIVVKILNAAKESAKTGKKVMMR